MTWSTAAQGTPITLCETDVECSGGRGTQSPRTFQSCTKSHYATGSVSLIG